MSIREGMAALSAFLSASLEASSVIQHRLTKGEYRERVLAQVLRPYIPLRYTISSGEVVNSQGQSSRQQDIIISDAYSAAAFLSSGDIAIHPVEGVVATLQVRSAIDTGAVREAVENVVSVKRLLPDEPRGFTSIRQASLGFGETRAKPFGAIVAYSAEGDTSSLMEAYAAVNLELDPWNRCNALFVLNRFTLVWGLLDGRVEPDPDHGRQALIAFDAGRDSAVYFYVLLMRWLDVYQPPPYDLIPYVNAAGIPARTVIFDVAGTARR